MSIGESVQRIPCFRVVRAACALVLVLAAGCGATHEGSVDRASPWLARPAEAPTPPAHALAVRFGGLDALLADPRDAGLRRALSMLDDRLIELPGELGKPVPPGVLELVVDIVGSPWELTVDLDHDWDGSGPPPVRAQLTIHCRDVDAAQSLWARIAPFGLLAPFPSKLVPGQEQMKTMEHPVGKLTYGTPAGSDRFVFAWGEPVLDAPAPGRLGLPKGVAPALAIEADLGKLSGTIETLLAREQDEDARKARTLLAWFGLLGDAPYTFCAALGQGSDRMQAVARYGNWRKIAERQGSLASQPLSAAELHRIPVDATEAILERWDPRTLLNLVDLVTEMEGSSERAELEQALGIDLDADVFGPLGSTFGGYMSDTTGGGGLASLVVFLSVDDEARLEATIARGIDEVRTLASQETEGFVAVREWEHGGARCRSLSFPGIPMPFEVSLALDQGFLVLAATPGGLVAALDQARGRGPGLADHPALRGLGGGALADLQELRFANTPRLLAGGYGLASLVSSAIANGVRSRTDGAREPGLVVPPLHELEVGSRPAIWLARIQGDDLVVQGECDGSVVANATAWLGGPKALLVGLGIASSVALPAVVGRMQLERAAAFEMQDESGY